MERIAVGGMAEIFKAKTRGVDNFEKVLAIKRLHRRLCEDQDFAMMLVDEAKIAVQLNHANIGQVFDLGFIDEQYFIVMEYIDGPDLHQILRRLRAVGQLMPVDVAVHIIARACEALHYAHTKAGPDGRPLEIVHRDVSPQNVMVSREGEVKLVDFGIAKARSRVQQTQAGIIKGKFYYMSPEQAHGHRVDPRTDIYALGIVLYEILAGHNPYEGVEDGDLLKRVRMADFAPLHQVASSVDPALAQIVQRAVARNPAMRFASAYELQRALVGWAHQHCQPFSRMDLAEFIVRLSAMNRNMSTERLDYVPMQKAEYTASEASVIYDAGPPSPDAPYADGYDAPYDASDNPFEEEEHTRVFDRSIRASEEAPAIVGNGYGPPDYSGQAGGQAGGRAGAFDEFDSVEATAIIGSPEYDGSQDFEGYDPTRVDIAGQGAAGSGHDGPGHGGPGHDGPGHGGPGHGGPGHGGPGFPGHGFPGHGFPEQGHGLAGLTGALEAPTRESPHLRARQAMGPGPVNRPGVGDAEHFVAPGPTPVPEATPVPRARLAGGLPRRTLGLVAAIALGFCALVVVLLMIFNSAGTRNDGATEVDPGAVAAAAGEVHVTHVTLPVSSSPANAQVYVNGELRGATPLQLEGLEVGRSYTLEFRRTGYAETTVQVVAEPQPDPLVVTLASDGGILKVSTYPAGVAITINGEDLGPAPVTAIGLARGESHIVLARTDDGRTIERAVEWKGDDARVKEIQLDFDDAPTGATASAGTASGDSAGTASAAVAAAKAPAAAERKTSSARKTTERKTTRRTTTQRKTTTSKTAQRSSTPRKTTANVQTLPTSNAEPLNIWDTGSKSDSGFLTVRANDSGGARVYIDGKPLDRQTPVVKHSLKAGTYEVKVYFTTLKRYSEARRVTVRANQTANLTFSP